MIWLALAIYLGVVLVCSVVALLMLIGLDGEP